MAQARAAIDAGTGTQGVYATGIVYQVDSYNSTYHSITYWISDDGTTTNPLEVYGGLGIDDNTNQFTSINDIQVNDIVVVCGNLTKFNTTYEFAQNNRLISLVRKVATPTFYPVAGAVAQNTEITISCATNEATIYYTTDGTDPSTSSTQYNAQSKPTITAATTIKAIAVKDGYTDSDIASAEYTILVPAATPTFSPGTGTYTWAQDVTISTTTDGATIYYTTNGDYPTTGSTQYTGAIAVSETKTIKAIAVKAGMANSAVGEATYTMNIPAINAENVNIAYNATSGELEYTITNPVEGGAITNAEVTASTPNGWLTVNGSNPYNSPISLTCEANETTTAHTAIVTLTYTYSTDKTVSKAVTITQSGIDYAELPFAFDSGRASIDTTAGLTQENLGTDYASSPKLKFEKGNKDNDGLYSTLILKINEDPGVLTYKIKGNSFSGSTFKVQVSTNGSAYTDIKTYTTLGDAQTDTIDNLAANVRYIKWIYTEKVNGNVALGDIKLAAYDYTPSITINPGPYNINCNGGNAELPVTTANLAENPQLAVVFCNSDGSAPASYNHDWISAEINTNGNVDGHISVNTGEARSAYFKVSGLAADNTTTVYSELVTINQAEYILSIVFETASIDLAAGSETDRKISFDYSGLGDNPTFEVRRYESDGTTPAIYDWLTTTISGNKVKITVPANDGAARTAYFKVYGENGNVNTLSNLVTVNQAAHVDTYTLITDVNQIVSGKHYIIVGKKNDVVKAMGYDKGNNRHAVLVTEKNNTINDTVGVYEFVINGPIVIKETNYYTIYDTNENSTGYLYAAGGNSNNYLKTQATNDNKGQWTIEINSTTYVATIRANVSGRNLMQYNSSSTIFSCYSGAQDGLYLYVKVNDNNLEYYGSEITYPENSIPDGGSIMVGAGSVVTVSSTFTNTDNASIIIEDGGQLVHENPVSATIQKNVTGYGSKSVSGWYLIASPVANLPVGCATTGSYDFFKYDEETYTWLNQKVTAHHITNFEQGVGYLYANSAATVIDYMGTLVGTNTKVTKAMSFACDNAGLKGFNLMGNPFSRNLVAGDMILNDTAVTTYYTIEGGSEFVARKISTNPIKPGQGFFVQASAEGQNLVFNPTAKGRNENNGYISIKAGNSEFTDNAFVQIANGNTLRKMTLSDNSSIVYVMNGGKDYAAARIDALEGSMPVCFKANKLGSYTITIEAKDIKTEYLHLINNISHEDIDLLLDPSYTFIASDGDNASRFTLVFRAEGNANTTNDIFAYQNGDDIIVNGEGELQIFDVMGRMIATQHINGTETVNVNAIGVYIFKLNEKTQKIVVR